MLKEMGEGPWGGRASPQSPTRATVPRGGCSVPEVTVLSGLGGPGLAVLSQKWCPSVGCGVPGMAAVPKANQIARAGYSQGYLCCPISCHSAQGTAGMSQGGFRMWEPGMGRNRKSKVTETCPGIPGLAQDGHSQGSLSPQPHHPRDSPEGQPQGHWPAPAHSGLVLTPVGKGLSSCVTLPSLAPCPTWHCVPMCHPAHTGHLTLPVSPCPYRLPQLTCHGVLIHPTVPTCPCP